MTKWEVISREIVNGFDIVFSVDMLPGGDSWFIARVQAFRDGAELAVDYLDVYMYDSVADFVKGDYYTDMVSTVTRAARTKSNIAKVIDKYYR